MDTNIPFRGHDPAGQEASGQTALDPRSISVEQLARLGVAQLAYVKPVLIEGKPVFAIHAADGTPLALAESSEVALAAVAQHDMVASLVH